MFKEKIVLLFFFCITLLTSEVKAAAEEDATSSRYTTHLFLGAEEIRGALCGLLKITPEVTPNVKCTAGGGRAFVWKCTFDESPPVALRMAGIGFTDKPDQRSMITPEHHIVLTELNHPPEGKLPLTAYFPTLFGFFHGRAMPADWTSSKYPRLMKPNYLFRYEVMDWVDHTFEDIAEITDSMLFEAALGEWVGWREKHIVIGDRKSKNFGLKEVPHIREYEIEGIGLFSLPAGLMPVRLDLEEGSLVGEEKIFDLSLPVRGKLTANGARFLKAMDERKRDFFTLLADHFREFLVDQEAPEAMQFKIPQDLVDREQRIFHSAQRESE